MKKLVLLLALIICTLALPAQGYFRVGYVANMYNMKNYNAMIDRYNVTRPWLSTQMPHMTYMFGPDIAGGGRTEATGAEIYFRSAWGTVSGSGSPTSGAPVSTRDLRAKETYMGLDLYVRVIGRCALSCGVEGSMFKTKTRVDGAEWDLTDKKLSVGITPGIKIFLTKGFFVPVLQVYYSIPFIKEDHTNAWYTLDAANAASEPEENFRSRSSHVGLSLSFALGDCDD